MELSNAPSPGDDDVDMQDATKKTVRTQEFSAELLNVYYTRLFPYNEMYRWLSYGNHYGEKKTVESSQKGKVSVGQPEYFFHREISFTLDVSGEEVYIRYLNFQNAEEMRKKNHAPAAAQDRYWGRVLARDIEARYDSSKRL